MHKSGKICCLDAKIPWIPWDLKNKYEMRLPRSQIDTKMSVICHKTSVWRTCHQGCQATISLWGLITGGHWLGSGNINSSILAQKIKKTINHRVSTCPSLPKHLDLMLLQQVVQLGSGVIVLPRKNYSSYILLLFRFSCVSCVLQ